MSYDEATGDLKLLCVDPSIRFYDLSIGYLQVVIEGEQYLAHRLIWKMMTGIDPVQVDHKDGLSNKWDNLRHATMAENCKNRRVSRNNRSGVKGVSWETARRKWRAVIGSQQGLSGLQWFGRFDTLEDAKRAIEAKRLELHGEFARNA